MYVLEVRPPAGTQDEDLPVAVLVSRERTLDPRLGGRLGAWLADLARRGQAPRVQLLAEGRSGHCWRLCEARLAAIRTMCGGWPKWLLSAPPGQSESQCRRVVLYKVDQHDRPGERPTGAFPSMTAAALFLDRDESVVREALIHSFVCNGHLVYDAPVCEDYAES